MTTIRSWKALDLFMDSVVRAMLAARRDHLQRLLERDGLPPWDVDAVVSLQAARDASVKLLRD